MKKFKNINAIQKELKSIKQNEVLIGFVPTMGALHNGHIRLIEEAKKKVKCVVVSIFVNPTQFNDKADFEKYPRTINEDLKLLQKHNVDIVFFPDTKEIYGQNINLSNYQLDGLDMNMEGKFRPGHFQGVAQIVHKLFSIIEPDFAYFGEKDFQQLSIIKHIVSKLKIPVQIIAVPTVRNDDGLALSSRNARLTINQQQQATVIYRTLQFIKKNINFQSPNTLKEIAIQKITKDGLKVEYLEFVNPKTLISVENEWEEHVVACVAVYCGDVRLIDNITLI